VKAVEGSSARNGLPVEALAKTGGWVKAVDEEVLLRFSGNFTQSLSANP
jgi:hypothetical protein